VRCAHERLGRRGFLGLLGVGLAVAACGRPPSPDTPAPNGTPAAQPPGQASGAPDLVPGKRPPAPVAGPHGSMTVHGGPPESVAARKIALTVDDGFCEHCVGAYAEFVRRSGVHLTFSPNGLYAHAWEPHAAVLRPLIDEHQIQIMNHTFNHPRLTKLPAGTVRSELERNEAWIHRTFGTSTRPYYRPPYGVHNARVDEVAADQGYTRVVLWDGSYSDSELITPQFLLGQARKYLTPGVIMLGHANHPTVLGLFDQIMELIKERELTPVTLDELFNTHRPGRVT
jgi:peptidoglycan/xylan/chitin deacetylase (PgdA/CDA1 family)